MCRPPVCRLPMCPGPPICRGPLAVRVSGPAGSLPCREEWFGCPGIRNSKFQRRYPASRNPACQQFGIPNSIIGFTAACASKSIRSVPGEDDAQPDRVAPPRPWNGAVGICGGRGRLARKGVLPAYLAAFPRGRCPAMRRPEARPGAGIGWAVRGRAKQSDLGSCIVPAAFRPGLARGTRRTAAALRTVAARRIPYRKLRRLKVLTRLRLSSSLHAGRITDIRSRTDADRAPVEEHR
ncbi:hypothetical protein SAMN05421512_107162 [Stappia indica]|uniref:Uncharacterized protein n=1 Tax=Stappia indica TaxID=538381 RepID=A0A285SY13_9HYPH|nr:hypothetical protein SAMN05421512_107162 [Stappia indica]